ncbi:hypothetical protein BpHYR1_035201 [Brachionus plicatilis]|uniref:HTH psq-type domain-containing protein n=1 Tax=Brachionus plicatilis TaxID=10195 RepID=A0A3M7T9M7_BRAPC|nr:hypothetical protein BpHYR1_035201 [Brachionus plicatilis]
MTKIIHLKEEALRIRVYAKEVRIWSNTENNDLNNISQRQAAKKFDISQQMVSKLLKKLQIKPRKKMKTLDRTECKKKNLYLKNPNISWILDDESYFTLSHGKISGNDKFTRVTLLQHQQVQNVPQLRNLIRNYLFGWSFLRGEL